MCLKGGRPIAAIPEATIDQVRNSVNIADYVGQYVALHKAGQNLFGICPFHSENTPSFSVNESKQIFKCFSCGRGGNVFSFVMDYDKLSFPEAVAKVAEFAHIPLNIDVGPTHQDDPATAQQKKLLQAVADLGHHILVNTESGTAALAYLTKRGLTRETLDHFAIGYLPASKTLLKTFLTNQHYDYNTLRDSGLFVESQQGELFDRFNDRVMFPLRNEHGDVVGFSGRVLANGDAQAKYLNSPETALFEKSRVLFNLDEAAREFKTSGGAILFEGFMDVIAAYQAGVPNGIASMGTSLTATQVGIIAHHTRQVTVCYDGDSAGQHATARALELLAAQPQLKVSVVVLPAGQDPDDFIQTHEAGAFAKQVQSTLTPISFQLHYLALDRDLTNDQAKLDYIQAALKVIAGEGDAVAQSVYLSQLAERTGVAVTALQQSLPAARPQPVAAPPGPDYQAPAPVAQAAPANKYVRAERTLLALAWRDPEIARALHQHQIQFPDAGYQALFDAWLAYAKASAAPTTAGYLDTLAPELVAQATDVAMMTVPEQSDAAIADMFDLLAHSDVQAKLRAVKQQLHSAQQLGDKQAVSELATQYLELTRQAKQMTQNSGGQS